MTLPSPLASARRIVVKVGSVLLANAASGRIRQSWLDALARDLAPLHGDGRELLVVSSGAAAAGRAYLPEDAPLRRLEERQAAAAVGQIALVNAWRRAFRPHGVTVAQMLLGPSDIEVRRNSLNARATLDTLLRLRIVPVINENDTVATGELRYGDNDRLAARVAQLASAEALVMLSSTDGLYTADPVLDPSARHVPEVARIDAGVEAMAGESANDTGSGGMVTKLQAARIVTAAGCSMAIADGRGAGAFGRLLEGARATWFRADDTPLSARKRWIASQADAPGAVGIDDGAARALRGGKSLLPAGVASVRGEFGRGDPVRIEDSAGRTLGLGIASYGSDELQRIAGRRSGEIEAVLGYRRRDEFVHRDDMVLPKEAARE